MTRHMLSFLAGSALGIASAAGLGGSLGGLTFPGPSGAEIK
jgi:hypothetical protein